jgi:hypothetical protein
MEPRLSESDIERRRRDLVGLCGALLGGALLAGGLVAVAALREETPLAAETPSTTAFVLGFLALLVILLSSAARSAVLRRAQEREDDAESVAQGMPPPPVAAQRLAAYVRATQLCFTLLAAAAFLGLAAALAGRAPFYGLVACSVSVLAMAVRWPRRSLLDELLARPRATPEERQ